VSLLSEIERLPDAAARRSFLESRGDPIRPEEVEEIRRRVEQLLRSDAGRARDLADAACHAADLAGDEAERVRTRVALGYANHALGLYGAAVSAYEQAAREALAAGDEEWVARTRIASVDALMYLSRHEEALRIAAETRTLLRGPEREALAAKLHWNEGNVHHRMDHYPEALKCYERARRIFRRRGDEFRVAVLDLNRAVVLSVVNAHEKARRLFDRARAVFDRKDLRAIRVQCDYNRAYLHFLRGRHTEALAELDRVGAEFEELGDRRHLALCDMDRSEILLRLNLPREAEEKALAAAAIFRDLAMRMEEGKSLVNAGLAKLGTGSPDEAREDLERAVRLFREEGNEVWSAVARLCQAEALLRYDEPAEAGVLAASSAKTLAAHGVGAKAAWAGLVEARAALALGDEEEAEDGLDRLIEDDPEPWLAWRAHQERGRVAARRGDLDEAREHFDRSIGLVEEMRGVIGGDELKASFVADKTSVYGDMVELRLAEGDPGGALAYVERGRSAALVDLLAGRAAAASGSTGERELLARIERARGDLNFLHQRVSEFEGKGGQRSAGLAVRLRGELAEREGDLAGLLRSLEVSNPELASLNSAPAVREEVVDLAEPGTTILEYFLTDRSAHVFVVRNGRVKAVRCAAGPEEIAGRVDRLTLQLAKFGLGRDYVTRHARQLSNGADAALEELHEDLLDPVLDEVGDDHLIVIPHGCLHRVPFHALRSGGDAVLADREVTYAPSARVLRSCMNRVPAGTGPALLLGAPGPSTPFILEEIEGIRRELDSPVVRVGRRATRKAIERHGRNARFLHLAAHGVFREDAPAFSGLRLADGWLRLFEVYGLRLGAELVTLSACDTGLDKVLGGDELLGLCRGFLYAGTPTVVASRWRVDDESTAELMRRFYENLREGRSPASAIRAAGLAVRERHEHPYYWAPFVVLGRPRGVPRVGTSEAIGGKERPGAMGRSEAECPGGSTAGAKGSC